MEELKVKVMEVSQEKEQPQGNDGKSSVSCPLKPSDSAPLC